MSEPKEIAPGWLYAQGDPPGTVRYWNGTEWQGEARPHGQPAPRQPDPVQPQPVVPASGGWTGTQKTAAVATLVAVLLGLVGWWWFSNGRQADAVASDFMTGLQNDDYALVASVVGSTCPSVSDADDVFDAQWFEERLDGQDLTDFQISRADERYVIGDGASTVLFSGTATWATGNIQTVMIEVVDLEGWVVCGWEFDG